MTTIGRNLSEVFETHVVLPLCSAWPGFFRLFYPNRKWGLNVEEDVEVLLAMSPREFQRRLHMAPVEMREEWFSLARARREGGLNGDP